MVRRLIIRSLAASDLLTLGSTAEVFQRISARLDDLRVNVGFLPLKV